MRLVCGRSAGRRSGGGRSATRGADPLSRRTRAAVASRLAIGLAAAASGCVAARAEPLQRLCDPAAGPVRTVASAAHRADGGRLAVPAVVDRRFGFAWPDTPLGFLPSGGGYLVFSSDGARHARTDPGAPAAGGTYGSLTRTQGTLDDPLGARPPVTAMIAANPDDRVNPAYPTYSYLGAGPVWRVPPGRPGAGGLLAIYHAEIGKLSLLGLCRSLDEGARWTDLGEVVRFNHSYRTKTDPGFAIGTPPIVVSPDGAFVHVYFQDWLASGAVTRISVARAPLDVLAAAAFGPRPHAAAFAKFDRGRWDAAGLGGASQDLAPDWRYTGGLNAAFDEALGRYVMITSDSQNIGYAESADGLSWSDVALLGMFGRAPVLAGYGMPVGEGPDPAVLGAEFFVYYTLIPASWRAASVRRFQVSCTARPAPPH